MLHPDPMGSPFADAAASLLRKLTFKGKWTLAFCNIQIPPVHYHNIKFIPFFPPPGLNVCSHDRPSEPWYKCEEHRKSPMITRRPLGWWLTPLSLEWKHLETSDICPLSSQIMCPPWSCPFYVREARVQTTGKQMIRKNICVFLKEALKHLEMEISGIKYVLINSPPIFHPKLCPCSCEHCVSQSEATIWSRAQKQLSLCLIWRSLHANWLSLTSAKIDISPPRAGKQSSAKWIIDLKCCSTLSFLLS